jgi:thiamine-monophosphate kinase
MDVSDGIISDITRICDESGTGAVIYADNLPVSYSALKIGADNHEDAAGYALYGGEDYELLFTVAEKNIAKFMKFAALNCVNASQTGVITGKKGIYIKQGAKIHKEDNKKIWNHF